MRQELLYRGTAQSTLDLLEGRVEMQFGTIPPTLAHIRAGKLRALAVTGATIACHNEHS